MVFVGESQAQLNYKRLKGLKIIPPAGTTVMLKDIHSKPELNGQKAIILGPDHSKDSADSYAKDRVPVQLVGSTAVMSVRSASLDPVPREEPSKPAPRPASKKASTDSKQKMMAACIQHNPEKAVPNIVLDNLMQAGIDFHVSPCETPEEVLRAFFDEQHEDGVFMEKGVLMVMGGACSGALSPEVIPRIMGCGAIICSSCEALDPLTADAATAAGIVLVAPTARVHATTRVHADEEQEMWRLACESIVDLQRGLWPQAVANPHVQPRWRLSHRKRAEDSHHAPAAESKPTAANFHLVLKVGAAVEAIREEGGDEWEPATVSAIEDETVSLMFADRFRIWQVPFQRVRTPASATC